MKSLFSYHFIPFMAVTGILKTVLIIFLPSLCVLAPVQEAQRSSPSFFINLTLSPVGISTLGPVKASPIPVSAALHPVSCFKILISSSIPIQNYNSLFQKRKGLFVFDLRSF